MLCSTDQAGLLGKYKTFGKYPNRKLHCGAKPGPSEPYSDQVGGAHDII